MHLPHFVHFFKPVKRDPRHILGENGERIAARFLKQKNYRILRRNYRATGGGEVDLVCRDITENVLVFVEVKTRQNLEFGRPSSAVHKSKQQLIIRGASSWLRLLDNPEINFRFDIVEVIMQGNVPEINHIVSAFTLPQLYTF